MFILVRYRQSYFWVFSLAVINATLFFVYFAQGGKHGASGSDKVLERDRGGESESERERERERELS